MYDENDTVVSTYDLEDTGFAEFQHQERTTLDNRKEHVITGQTADGTFKVIAHMTETSARIASGPILPTWVKLDLEIDGFPYVRANTQLVLRTRVETQARIAIIQQGSGVYDHVGEGEGGIIVTEGDVTGFYSWVKNATVDGVEKPVRVTTTTTSNVVNVYFVYTRGDAITHDPKLGLPTPETIAEDGFDLNSKLLPYVVTFVAGAAVIGLAVQRSRKQAGTAQP